MKKARLNYAYGVKRPRLKHRKVSVPPKQLFDQIRRFYSSHFYCRAADLRFAQNVTTHVVQIVQGIKKRHPNLQVLVDSHEVPWVKTTFETGKTSSDMTRPNYARLRHKKIQPTTVKTIDPKKLLDNLPTLLGKRQPAVIILSHVSRMTGETFPIREIYSRMKSLNPNSVLIIDGAQVAGAMKFDVKGSCDAYITVTSKFLGAEPNIAVAYLSPETRSRYLTSYPHLGEGEFALEAHSAVQALSHPAYKSPEEKIKRMRALALEKIRRINGISIIMPKNQAPQILTLRVGNRAKTKKIVEELERKDVEIFHNMDWSIVEPRTPLLRVSIGAKTTPQEIEKFVNELKSVLK